MTTAAELAKVVGAEMSSASPAEIRRVSSIEDADEHAVVFAQDERALERALLSRAGLIFAQRRTLPVNDARVLWVRDPRHAMALAGRALAAETEGPAIHPTAVVHLSARLGARVRIGAGSVVEAGAMLGDDVVLHSRVTISQGVQIGARVVVQSGAVLGSLGFGYVRDPESGEYVLFPQQGSLVIEEDVEIGANTTIDRGALGETRIGRGTKIDNLVHIAHNCRVGRNVIIAAQVGISGSCVIEDGVTIAGQVGLGDHVRIGPGVILGGQSGVYPGKEVEGPGQIFAGTPAEPRAEYLRSLARVRRLK